MASTVAAEGLPTDPSLREDGFQVVLPRVVRINDKICHLGRSSLMVPTIDVNGIAMKSKLDLLIIRL